MPPKRPAPTRAEVEILKVLWGRGPQTVRQVHDVIARRRDVGYTTTLKLLQNMAEKRLVAREESARSHIYRATVAEESVKRRVVADLLDRLFDGSSAGLAMQALVAKPATADELREIRALLDRVKRK